MKRAVVLLLAWLLAFGPAFAECGEPAADLAVEALAASGPEGEAVVEINSTLAGDDPSPESEQPQTPAAPEPEEAPEPTALSVRKSATKTVWLGTVYRFTVPGKTVKSYSSGDKRIATVSRKGIVTLKKAGRVKITAKLKSGRKVVLTLKVADPLTPAAVAINEGETATVGIDDTFPLSASVSPQTAPQDVAWTSNRERVATVDENGLVTARAWGRATITAATPNKKTATFTLIVRKPYTKPFMISHAMGGIDGNNYTNCLEAFQENYAEGHRVFEVDFELTADREMVCCHDWWRKWSKSFHGKKPTFEQFMGVKLYGKYTPLCVDDLLKLMGDHPDITVITDNKYTDYSVVRKQFRTIVDRARALGLESVLDRFVVEIYNKKMLTVVSDIYPFKAYLFTLYKLFDEAPTRSQLKNVAYFCQKNGVSMIGMHAKWWKASYMDILREYDIDAALYTTNSERDAKRYLKQGVTALFTDFLPPLAD